MEQQFECFFLIIYFYLTKQIDIILLSGEKSNHGKRGGGNINVQESSQTLERKWERWNKGKQKIFTVLDKRSVYIFTFPVYNFKQVNVSGIQIFHAQLLALILRKVMLNAANIHLFGFIHTKCKYIYRSFLRCHSYKKLRIKGILKIQERKC